MKWKRVFPANGGRWQVRVSFRGKKHYVGVFSDPEEGARAADRGQTGEDETEDAPLVLDPVRGSHMIDTLDFYKPVGWPSMGPIVDGPGSIDVYYECLDGECKLANCRNQRFRQRQYAPLEV